MCVCALGEGVMDMCLWWAAATDFWARTDTNRLREETHRRVRIKIMWKSTARLLVTRFQSERTGVKKLINLK